MNHLKLSLVTGLMVFTSSFAQAGKYHEKYNTYRSPVETARQSFPTNPEESETPGSLCDTPDTHRYPEKIAYCERDVDTRLKYEIINVYNQKLGYRIMPNQRGDFKIDHYIPLCMGGSNHQDNLWPQHKSVYVHTDPLEGLLCEKMRDGKLLQKDAVEYIRAAKRDLSKAREIIREVHGL